MNGEDKLPVGKAIRALRKSGGMNQEMFAAKVGIQRSFVCALERGSKTVTLATLEKVEKATGVSILRILRKAKSIKVDNHCDNSF